MKRENGEKERVCVTGAGGYVASWLVKLLLSNGYFVHGTVRDPCDEEKNGHLKKLENATENLQLFRTDLLDYEGLCAAIAGCNGVFHVASPVPYQSAPNPEVELLEPAITGTRNVLNACLKAKVKKVVVVSSVAAVMSNPSWPKDRVMDESCWTDTEHCKTIKNWYFLSKTIAEREALGYAKRSELNIVTVLPGIVMGPMLQSTINATSLLLLSYIKGRRIASDTAEDKDHTAETTEDKAAETTEDKDNPIVDVRDVAEAILLAYEKPEAEGRYICSSYVISTRALVEKLKSIFPEYNYPKDFTGGYRLKLKSEKLQNLGWKYRPLEDTLIDTVKKFEETGLLCID